MTASALFHSRVPGDPVLPVVEWRPEADTEIASLPTSLAPFAGNAVDIAVLPGQLALILVEHEVQATLLPGQHRLWVCGPDPAHPQAHERQPKEGEGVDENAAAAARATSGGRGGEAPDVGVPARTAIAPWSHILFLRTAPPLRLRWGERAPTPVPDPDEGEILVRASGSVELSLHNPVRFYESFLRRCEDLGDRRLQRVVATLVHHRFARAVGDDPTQPPPAESLQPGLEDVGLTLLSLTVEEWEAPVVPGSGTAARTDEPAPATPV